MSDKPTPEDLALWQRRLAGQANNRAWTLCEQASRTAAEDDELLQAAHTAMFLWNIVGNANQRAHAAQLLAHAHALLKMPGPAAHYGAQSHPVFMAVSSAPWERALAHAVAANVAAANGHAAEHAEHHRLACEQVAALADDEERALLEATLRVLPPPPSSPARAIGTIGTVSNTDPIDPIATWHYLVQTQNPRGLDDLLAEDAVFISPVVNTPQRGKKITQLYLSAAFTVFFGPGFRYVREIVGARDAMLEFETEIEGVLINGVDIIRWNDEGRIVEFKVMLRPLKAVHLIHERMGAMLAAMNPP